MATEKLTDAEIQQLGNDPSTDVEKLRESNRRLMAELLRTRPRWVDVSLRQHKLDQHYDVAGTTADSKREVWIGRGKFDSEWGRWVDANTLKPFPQTTTITRYYKELTPPEFIGQPI